MSALRSTRDLGLVPDYEGKVRDIFDLGDRFLIVATDRISAFDVVMDDIVPGRGVVLNVMSLAWFKRFADVVPNHVITADPAGFPAPFADHAAHLGGRSVLVHKAQRFDVECVVRGYIAGSGWKSYRQDGTVCGHVLPQGLRLAEQLPEPIFTPATKEDEGHDENIPYEQMVEIVGPEHAEALRRISLRLYGEGAAFARPRGVILADTKFEFGLVDGRIILIDEVMTPDSSRFWPAAGHAPGQEPPSWDKQILRNHLATLDWDHAPPPPALPAPVLAKTSERYHEVLQILFPEEAAAWRRYL
ncbi:MAG: phosphoribosylaminoimidazolesuccinocarboxamide synthase [Krumholzibacteria bacterium]|nr:phosphoribosylaminoimidazolesuccinocarboxamide synthase [Candidatus Krumholzibacteria bacterium]